MNRRKVLIGAVVAVIAGAVAIPLGLRLHRWSAGSARIKGAVIVRDNDSRKE